MRPGAKRLLHAATLAAGGTGLWWSWIAYGWDPGPEPLDPMEMVEWTGVHPHVPLTRDLHLYSAPLLVFAVGLIWASHVAPRLRGWRARWRTGITLAAIALPMVVSGVALQTATSDSARTFWTWAHAVTGGAWVVAYAIHLAVPSRRAKGRPRPEA